jgi:drug/metabolite transporter (DMT)-like permease
MQGMEFIFFIAFALVIAGMYIAVRRHLAQTKVIAAAGIFGCIITLSLWMMSRPNMNPAQGIIMGIFIGTLMGLATLAVAFYFQRRESRHNT